MCYVELGHQPSMPGGIIAPVVMFRVRGICDQDTAGNVRPALVVEIGNIHYGKVGRENRACFLPEDFL